MPQIRVTKKFAKDLHLTVLDEPSDTSSIFDDWIIDIIRVRRKKVAMMTHIKSYLPLFITYESVGGAKQIVSGLGFVLSEWLISQGLSEFCGKVSELFSTQVNFCKTIDRKTLGHMNDYKRCAPFAWQDIKFEDIDWMEQTRRLADMPLLMKHEYVKYPTSGGLMRNLIERTFG